MSLHAFIASSEQTGGQGLGAGGVGVCSSPLKQEDAGSNPIVTNPGRGALRISLCNLLQSIKPMIGKP